jgi:tight adherence protein B
MSWLVLVTLGVFALVLGIIVSAYWFFVLRLEERDDRVLLKRLKPPRMTELASEVVKSRQRLSAVGPLDGVLRRWQATLEPLQRLIDRSGLQVTVGAVLLASVFVAMVTAGVVVYLTASGLLALGAAAVVAAGPFLFVRHKARKRLATFEEQFPQAIDLIARSLRAGHALTTALQMAGNEIADPVGAEFRTLFDQQNFGMSMAEALKAFAARMPLIDARFFVTALLTQRETGGNLAEVLDKLAAVIRERFKVKRQVRVMSAHGRITGMVLGFLPPAVALILFVIAPDHIRLLVDDPLGVRMVVAAIVLQITGVLIIRRIVNVEY